MAGAAAAARPAKTTPTARLTEGQRTSRLPYQQCGDQRDQDDAKEFACPATRLRQRDFRGCGAAEIPGPNLMGSGARRAGMTRRASKADGCPSHWLFIQAPRPQPWPNPGLASAAHANTTSMSRRGGNLLFPDDGVLPHSSAATAPLPELSQFGTNVYAYTVTIHSCPVRPPCRFFGARYVPLRPGRDLRSWLNEKRMDSGQPTG